MTERSKEAAEPPLEPISRLSQAGFYPTLNNTVGHLGGRSPRPAGPLELPLPKLFVDFSELTFQQVCRPRDLLQEGAT